MFLFICATALAWSCLSSAQQIDSVQDNPDSMSGNFSVDQFRDQRRCYEDLGCFTSGGNFFHPLYRPIDLLPQDREKIKTRFRLYTRSSPKEHHLLRVGDRKGLDHFAKGRDLKVIVHGYLDNQFFGEWMREMKDEFLLSGDMNVVIVDWSGGNSLPYIQASANTRLVGAEIALLVNWLHDEVNLDLSSTHILGHSLGSHVAGYAGERIRQLGRITAMDPAEPYFQNLPPTVRIDPTDAAFVDVIHTDSKSILLLGLGMSQLVGHVDFFPNGGREQPGCSRDKFTSIITDGLVQGVRDFVACNHQRAVSFVMDSINRQRCLPVGYLCEDWSSFENGECGRCGPVGTGCAVMGIGADRHKPPGTGLGAFYLKTHSESPFCLFSYQVILTISKDGKDQDGIVKLRIVGDKDAQTFTLGEGKTELNPGQTYHFLLTTKVDLGEISSLILGWEVSRLLPVIVPPQLRVSTLRVNPMNHIQPSSDQSLEYCLSAHPITSKKTLTVTHIHICDEDDSRSAGNRVANNVGEKYQKSGNQVWMKHLSLDRNGDDRLNLGKSQLLLKLELAQ